LKGQFVHGVDAVFGIEAGVGGSAVDDQNNFTNALARCLQVSPRAVGRFEDQDGVASSRFPLDDCAGRFAAYFFIGSPQED
jgi:hypothetical protein